MRVQKTYQFDIKMLVTRFKIVVRRREPHFWSKFRIKVCSKSNSFMKWNAKCFALIAICDETSRPKEHSLSLSCSLSFALTHALTPLAEHFPFGPKGYPHQTQMMHYLARSDGTFFGIAFLSRKQPFEHYILHSFACSENFFLTLAILSSNNPLNTTIILRAAKKKDLTFACLSSNNPLNTTIISRAAKKFVWHLRSSQAATHWTLYFESFFA